jgi:alpha-tubulin suppressor-like RCC1 family protein
MLSEIDEVTTTSTHACARRRDGTVWCWGANRVGQLGLGSTDMLAHPTPSPVPSLPPATSIGSASATTCITADDGSLWCWGSNNSGKAGSPTASPVPAPSQVKLANGEPLEQVAEVRLGFAHGCARRLDGSVWCWGDNTRAQTGSTPDDAPHAPQVVGGIDQVSELAAGAYSTCARRTGQTLWCWGANDFGQLGYVDPKIQSAPNPVPELGKVASPAVAWQFACTISDEGIVLCWGALSNAVAFGATANSKGELGDCTLSGHVEPRPVVGLP